MRIVLDAGGWTARGTALEGNYGYGVRPGAGEETETPVSMRLKRPYFCNSVSVVRVNPKQFDRNFLDFLDGFRHDAP